MSRAGSRGRSGWAPLARQPRVPAHVASRPAPNEPERRPLHEYVIPDQAGRGRTLHEPAARWTPNEPDPGNEAMVLAAGGGAASGSKRARKPLGIRG